MLSDGEAVVEVVTDFRANDDVVALVFQCRAEEGFAVALAVGVGGVEVVDSQLETVVHASVLRVQRPKPTSESWRSVDPSCRYFMAGAGLLGHCCFLDE